MDSVAILQHCIAVAKMRARKRSVNTRPTTLASKGQKAIYHGQLKPFENLLLRTPLVPWSYFASNFYHNVYWYPFVGRPRVEAALNTKWGQLFRQYGDGHVVMPGMQPKTVGIAAAGLAALGAAVALGGYLASRKKNS